MRTVSATGSIPAMAAGQPRRIALAVATAFVLLGCASAPPANPPGGGPNLAGGPNGGGGGNGGNGRGNAAGGPKPAQPSATDGYPDHFSGTIGGQNGVDSWTGSATFDRRPKADECNQGGAAVCYAIVGGSVTWTVEGRTKTIQLSQSTAADGIVLIVSDASHPDRNGTYEISVAPSTDIFIDLPNGPRLAFDNVRDWVNVIDFPKIPADWHLAGQSSDAGCGIDGCGAGQSWTWDLQGTFGP